MIKLYLYEIRRYVLYAVLPALVAGLLVTLYVHREPKIYSASTSLYVQQPAATQSSLTGTDVQGSNLLAPTFSQMITNSALMARVNQVMQRRYPGYDVGAHSLGTDQQPGVTTSLITLSVRDTNPQRAAAAANAVARVFIHRLNQLSAARFQKDQQGLQRQVDDTNSKIQHLTAEIKNYKGSADGLTSLKGTLDAYNQTYQTLLASLAQFKVQRDATVNTVSVYYPATVPSSPIGPSPFRDGILAAIAVLFLTVAGIRLRDYLDDSFRSPEEVEQAAGAPILGTVQRFPVTRSKSLIAAAQPQSQAAEAYRLIRTNLQFVSVDSDLRLVLVTSAHQGEGKSTTVANLAHVFASAGRDVTVVDCDLRRPSQSRLFSVSGEQGLTSMIVAGHVNGQVTTSPDAPNLAIVPSGPRPPNPSELLSSPRLSSVLQQILARDPGQLVLLDSPPALPVADASVLASVVDGVVLVIDIKRTTRKDLERAVRVLDQVGGKLVGIVVNQLDASSPGYYYHYGYEYSYGHGSATLPASKQTPQTADTKAATRS